MRTVSGKSGNRLAPRSGWSCVLPERLMRVWGIDGLAAPIELALTRRTTTVILATWVIQDGRAAHRSGDGTP